VFCFNQLIDGGEWYSDAKSYKVFIATKSMESLLIQMNKIIDLNSIYKE
jgi:hypothetical protein